MAITKCSKRIGQKIQPKQFHSLEIACEYEDVIEWKDVAERQDKLDKLTKNLLLDYKRTKEKILEDLGLSDKPVSVTETSSDAVKHATVAVPDAKPKQASVAKNNMEDFFDGV